MVAWLMLNAKGQMIRREASMALGQYTSVAGRANSA
jgi:hypothetical protein